MNILIVEDDLMMQKALHHELSQSGHRIFLAANGQEAIALINISEKIDLIISDILMPVISGPIFISLLKNYYFKNTPVVVMSNMKNGPEVLQEMGVEYDCFLAKPLDFAFLAEVVRRFEHVD